MGQIHLQAVLAGGVVLGVLSALPIVDTCCCLWMIAGGMVAAYLTQQNRPDPIQMGDGALAGLLAGIAGAVIYALVSLPVQFITAPIRRRVFQGFMDSAADMPPEFREYLDGFAAADGGIGAIFIGLLVSFPFILILGSVFSTIGGLLGALFFKRNTPPVPATAPPPPLG